MKTTPRLPAGNRRLSTAAIAAWLTLLPAAAAPVLSPDWHVELGARPAYQPAPIESGGVVDGFAVALSSGEIVVVGPRGEKTATFRLDHLAATVIAGKAAGGGQPVIYAVDVWGSVYCFHTNGERLWKYERNEKTGDQRPAVLADVDGDGVPEVIVTDSKGHINAIDAHGKLRLEIESPQLQGVPTVGDVDGDGAAEILFGTENGGVYCVRGNGELLWAKQLPAGFGAAVPVSADAGHDVQWELYLTSNRRQYGLFSLDASSGKRQWYAPSLLESSPSIAVADLDQDGQDEILYGDKNTRLYCVDAKGRAKWNLQLGGRGIFRAPAVVRRPEGGALIFQVVRDAGPGGYSLYVVDASGRLLQSLPVAGGGMNSPMLCRLRGGQSLRLVVLSANGGLSAYHLPAGSGGVLWPGARNDFAQSGFVGAGAKRKAAASLPARAAVPAATVRATGGTNRVALTPAPAGTFGALSAVNPDGSIRVELVQAPAASASFTATRPGVYRLATRWLDAAGGGAVKHFRYLLDAGFAEDRQLLSNHLRELDRLRAGLPQYADLISFFAGNARTSLDRAIRSQSAALFDAARQDRQRHLALLDSLQRQGTRGPLAVSVLDNPWIDLDTAQLFGSGSGSKRELTLPMLGGEFESAAVAITNLRAEAVTVHASAGAFQSAAGQQLNPTTVMEFRGVPLVRTDIGKLIEDPLPLLGKDQSLRLAPGETAKLWLRFNSHALDAGEYRSTLSFSDFDLLALPVEVPVTLRISPIRLPAGFRYKHCNWLSPTSFGDKVVREAAIRDALEHGTNVFIIPAVTLTVAADGSLGAPVTAVHDELVGRLRGKALFLISGSVNLTGPGARSGNGVNEHAYAEAVRWYAAHMRSLGLGYGDYAFYITDEPALMGDDEAFQNFVAGVKRVKAADAKVQIYANPTGGATARILAPLAGLVDIWCPHLPLAYDPQMEKLFKSGKQYWHYEARSGQRMLDPLGYYRRKPWVAYSLGMTGGGFWIYQNYSYGWIPRDLTTPEWGTVYSAARGWVTSKRWEASLDGSEDYELLRLLEDRTAGTAFKAEAADLIKQAVAFLTADSSDRAPDFHRWTGYKQKMTNLLERAARR